MLASFLAGVRDERRDVIDQEIAIDRDVLQQIRVLGKNANLFFCPFLTLVLGAKNQFEDLLFLDTILNLVRMPLDVFAF